MFRGIKQIPLPRNTIRSCIAKKPKSVLDFGFFVRFSAQIARPASEQGAQGLGQERGEDLVALVGRVQAIIGQS